MEKAFKIFVDFDGTITIKDIGEEIFRHFAEKDKVEIIIDDLLKNKISSRNCWEQLCKAVPEIEKAQLDKFIDSMTIEPSFISFANYCHKKGDEIIVLSDGFDYYIERIFNLYSINSIKVYANNLSVAENKLVPSFPFYNESCFVTANCKRTHVITNSSDEDYTVFIGDGNSDKDVVEYCDFIFAKHDLLRYCEINRITFLPFKDFEDVKERLNDLRSKKRLKKRSRAQLNRQKLYSIEY